MKLLSFAWVPSIDAQSTHVHSAHRGAELYSHGCEFEEGPFSGHHFGRDSCPPTILRWHSNSWPVGGGY